MQEKYRNMTPEECATRFKRNKIIYFTVYTLALIAAAVLCIKRYIYIFPLKYENSEMVEIFNGLHRATSSLFLIRVIVCFLIITIVISIQQLFFTGIFHTLCDPDKYTKAEEILFRQNFFFRKHYKYAILQLAMAYSTLNDYENAWNYCKKIVPANLEKCRKTLTLSTLASYFYDSGDKENAALYIARLEALKASGKKNLQLDLALDDFKIHDAVDKKDFDVAKELLGKYINNTRISLITRTHYQYLLGIIAYETKDYPEAIYRLKSSLETGSKLPFAKDAGDRLEEIIRSLGAFAS